MKIFDDPQGSTAWLSHRCKVVTASEADALVTPLWKARTGDGVRTYLYQKLTERAMGVAALVDVNAFAVEQGAMLENEAIPFLQGVYDYDIRRVGFCQSDDDRIGCSPDGLIGEDGGCEIKCPQPRQHLRYLLEGVLPADYAVQVHFSMLVTGRPWWLFVSYSRHFPPFILKVFRDEKIQQSLKYAVDLFYGDFDKAWAQVKQLREAYNVQMTERMEESA